MGSVADAKTDATLRSLPPPACKVASVLSPRARESTSDLERDAERVVVAAVLALALAEVGALRVGGAVREDVVDAVHLGPGEDPIQPPVQLDDARGVRRRVEVAHQDDRVV